MHSRIIVKHIEGQSKNKKLIHISFFFDPKCYYGLTGNDWTKTIQLGMMRANKLFGL